MARQQQCGEGRGSAERAPSLGSGRATCPTPSLAHVSAATASSSRAVYERVVVVEMEQAAHAQPM